MIWYPQQVALRFLACLTAESLTFKYLAASMIDLKFMDSWPFVTNTFFGALAPVLEFKT
jgi:hypothetical protein